MEIESSDEPETGFVIYNMTDGVPFDPRTFQTEAEAWAAASEHRAAYGKQGYYLTADGLRIDPAALELEVVGVGESR